MGTESTCPICLVCVSGEVTHWWTGRNSSWFAAFAAVPPRPGEDIAFSLPNIGTPFPRVDVSKDDELDCLDTCEFVLCKLKGSR